MRFTRLTLENWKNFRSAEISLKQRAFIVGPNASGKSNFLDAFRFLSEIASVGGGFQSAIARRDGVTRIRCLAARRYPAVKIGVSIGTDEDEEQWRYEVSFTQDNNGNPAVQTEKVMQGSTLVLERPDSLDKGDKARLGQTFLEQVNSNFAFREVAEFLESVRYLHVVPQLIREPDRSVNHRDDPYGGDFLERLANLKNKRVLQSRLNRIQQALKVAVPQLDKLELYPDARGTPHLRGNYRHWRVLGAWQEERQFSDGTLRLIGLLWSILDGTGPLLLEEPELSLHAEIVRYLPQMFARMQRRSGRQILLSTHSIADLLSDTGIGLDEVLILRPTENGTEVDRAIADQNIAIMVRDGISLSDAVIGKTKPANAEQLALFGSR